jgi:hypothetical protein
MKKLRPATIILSTFISIGCADHLNADLIQYFSAASLSPADSVFTDPDSFVMSDPLPAFTTPDNQLTWSATDSDETYTEATAWDTYPFTSFPSGTRVLEAYGFYGMTNGGMATLSFANPVREFGLNIEEYNLGPYTVQFTAYNGAKSLGTFSATGNDTGDLSGMISFEGAKAINGDVITSVVFDDTAAGGSDNLAFGPVTYNDAPVASEPATFILIGIVAASSALIARSVGPASHRPRRLRANRTGEGKDCIGSRRIAHEPAGTGRRVPPIYHGVAVPVTVGPVLVTHQPFAPAPQMNIVLFEPFPRKNERD